MGFLDALRAPVLNDVSTDLEDPPAFVIAQHGPLPEAWKSRIRAAYPDVQPLRVKVAAADATAGDTPASLGAPSVIDAVTSTAKAMPMWEVVKADSGAAGAAPLLVLEAVSTTPLLKFKDDVCVRVRAEEAAAGGEGAAAGTVLRVDVRSKSRVGRGDLGANAARIRAFLAQLRGELTARGLQVL